ncbi:MAG: hypothetical protein ACLPID_17165 [Beijerinckiaceae bacterium]
MMKPKPPEGMSEEDYEAIEAAVMATVRGRGFLAEFARRSHIDEMRQMLDAMLRLEQVVTANQLAPANPSLRLLVSRLQQVGERLGQTAQDMRADGLDEKYCAGIETQVRALGGLLRLNGAASKGQAPTELGPPAPENRQPDRIEPNAAAAPPPMPAAPPPQGSGTGQTFERRLEALAAIDGLSDLEKLRLFA